MTGKKNPAEAGFLSYKYFFHYQCVIKKYNAILTKQININAVETMQSVATG